MKSLWLEGGNFYVSPYKTPGGGGGATPISKCPDVCVRDLTMDPF